MFLGRREIYTAETEFNAQTIPAVLIAALPIHSANAQECETLFKYYKGGQPIYEREKDVRADITYNTVVNFANSIVRDKVGYFLSSPMQYTLRNADKQNVFDEFKKLLSTEEKNSKDYSVALDAAICGRGYMMIITDKETTADDDDAPFEYVPLDARTTFVVRESRVTHRPVLGVTYYTEPDGKHMVYDVRTALEKFIYRVPTNGEVLAENLIEQSEIGLPVCPIVEYRNNKFMLGDFEIVLDLLNAMNTLTSNAREDIEQFIQSYLVFLNATIDDESFAKIKREKMFSLVSPDGSRMCDAKFISAQLNPQSVQNLKDTLYKALMFITATPERMQSPGGSPTGAGVSLGYGYPAQEHDARGKDMPWYEAERDMVRLTLAVLHKSGLVKALESRDITPMLNRTLFETAQSNAQTSAMMVGAKLWSPEDAIRFAAPTSDAEQAIKNAKTAYGDNFGGETAPTEIAVEDNVDEDINKES